MRTNAVAEREDVSFVSNARRTQIVECAIEVINDLGYARTSLDQIAGRLRISKGVISYHFTSKDDLIHEVFSTVFRLGADYMRPRVRAASGASARLRAYIESNLKFMGLYPKHILALVEIGVNLRTADNPWKGKGGKVSTSLLDLEQILREGQQQGEFRKFSVATMARSIRAALDAVPVQMYLHPEFDMGSCINELTALFDLATRK